jgi:hypothetical protein
MVINDRRLDNVGGSPSMPLCKAVGNLNDFMDLWFLTRLALWESEEKVYADS